MTAMGNVKSRAFVMSVSEYRETSAILHLLCETQGRVALVGRGVRSPRPKKPVLPDAFTLVQITYTLRADASMGNLLTIEPERSYATLRTRLEAYALANYWFEVIRCAIPERDPVPRLFSLSEGFMACLDGSDSFTYGTAWHLARLLDELGFGIRLSTCVHCGTPAFLEHFDVASGAAVCIRCARPAADYFPLGGRGLRQLADALGQEQPPQAPVADRRAKLLFLDLVNEFLAVHLERRMRSFSFLKTALA